MGSVQQHVGEVKENATLSVAVHLQIHLPGVKHVSTFQVVQVGDIILIMCLIRIL